MRLRASVSLGLAALFAVFVTMGATAARAQDPVGVWDMQADAQGQANPFTLTVTREGGVLKGKIASELYGNQDLADFKVDNGVVTYTRKLEFAGQSVEMLFKGTIDGDSMTGAYSVQGQEIPVAGTRRSSPGAPPGK